MNSNHPFKIPHNVYFMINRIKKAEKELIKLNLPISSKAISDMTNIELDKVDYLRNVPLIIDSLDAPVSLDDDSATVGDFIPSDIDIEGEVVSKLNRQQVCDIIIEMYNDKFIKKREASIVLLKNGFVDNRIFTLDEIGRIYNISRQRVDQIYMRVINKIKESKYGCRLAFCIEDEKIKKKKI